MVLIILVIQFFFQGDEDVLKQILESNRRCLTDTTGSYALSAESADRIIDVLKDSRIRVLNKIAKTGKKSSVTESSFKVLERVDLPYNSVIGIVWGNDFAYCYKKSIGTNEIEVRKIARKKLSEKSELPSHVVSEVDKWNVSLLKRMVFKPVNTWDKEYVNFLDSLKANTSYNLAQTGDAFYIATNVVHGHGDNVSSVATVAFDGF